MNGRSLILFVCMAIVLCRGTASEFDKTQTQDELESSLELLRNAITKLSLESELIEQNVRKTQQDLESETQSLVKTKESLNEKENELAKAQRYIDSLLGEIETKTQQLEILEATNADLENKLAQVKRERNTIAGQLAEEKNITSRLEADLQETKESLKLSREALETAAKQIEAAERDLEELRTSIRALEDVIEEKETTIQQLSEELENNVKERQQTEASLRIELEDSKKQLLACSEAIEKKTEVLSADEFLQKTIQQAKDDALEQKFEENEKNLTEVVRITLASFLEQAKAGKTKLISPWFVPSLEQQLQLIEKARAEYAERSSQHPPQFPVAHTFEPFEDIKDSVILQLENEKESFGSVFLDDIRPYIEALIHHMKKKHGLNVESVECCSLLVASDWTQPTYTNTCGWVGSNAQLPQLGFRFVWNSPVAN